MSRLPSAFELWPGRECARRCRERPSESERRQERAIWYTRRLLRYECGEKRGPSTALGMTALQGKGRRRKCFQYSCGRPIHPTSGIPSQENELRNGIPRFIEEAQRGIRSEICLRLGVAPTALVISFSCLPSPYGLG